MLVPLDPFYQIGQSGRLVEIRTQKGEMMADEPRANDTTIEALKNILQGLHVAMDAVIKEKDEKMAEETLQKLDHRLSTLIKKLTT